MFKLSFLQRFHINIIEWVFVLNDRLAGSPCWIGGVVLKWLKMSYNLNGSDALKLFTVFRKDDLGICISWIIEWFEEVVSSFWNLDPLAEPIFRLRRRFHNRGFQLSARLNPPYLQIFLKFCHIHSVKIGSNFVYTSCYILRIYFGGNQRSMPT